MTGSPEISVIIPCYNQAHFLEETVQSVLAQTFANWECLIINDGSPDNTGEIALQLVESDSRIRYLKKENGGLASARNFGIENSKAKYIFPLDSDDKIAPDYLLKALHEIKTNKDVKVVYCNAELFGEETGLWNLPEFSLQQLANGNMIFCSALFKKEDWEKAGGYDTNMLYGWEDWEFWIHILKNGGTVIKLPFTGFYYRIRNASMIRSMEKHKADYLHSYMAQKHAAFIYTHLGNPFQLKHKVDTLQQALDYITSSLPYRFYKKIKGVLSNK